LLDAKEIECNERERVDTGRQYRRHHRFSDSYYSSCGTSFCNSEIKVWFPLHPWLCSPIGLKGNVRNNQILPRNINLIVLTF